MLQVPEPQRQLDPQRQPPLWVQVQALGPVPLSVPEQLRSLQRGPGPMFQRLEQPVAQALQQAWVALTTCQ
jgi:hypothetical protein